MQQPDKRRLLIVGGAAIIFILAVIALLGQHETLPHKSQDYVGNANTQEASLQPTAASFVGFDNLITLGVTLDQANGLQTAFQHYKTFASANTVIDMSDGKITIVAPSQADPLYRPSITTTVLVDQRTTYHIRFYYWGTSAIQLLIYDSTGKTKLFDSGTVTGKS
jgi:hypothetical protein